jgi:two-component system sensor histidine kinase BaeS
VRLKLSYKLFLLLALVSVLAVGGTAWLILRQLEHGFVEYLDEVDSDHVTPLVDAVRSHYREHGDLSRLARGGWRDLHDTAFGLPLRPAPAGPQPPGGVRDTGGDADGSPKRAPPIIEAPRPARPRDPLNIAPRTWLTAADGTWIAGRPNLLHLPARPFPVVLDGATVATVMLTHRPRSAADHDGDFLIRQRHQIVAIAGGALLLSLLLSLAVAQGLARRIQSMARATAAIARGNFTARARTRGDDEIAELAGDINAMALALERLEQSRRNWLADIAHELRTPLATLQGEIEGMLDGLFPLDRESLKSLHEEVRHLTRLTGDLHQLALSDLGALPIHPAPTDVAGVVDRAVQRWQTAALKADLRLTKDVRAATASVDEDRLTQVMDNLLQNSLRYTHAGGEIAVCVAPQSNNVLITVDDSPPGVPAGDCARIFEPLFRADSARSRVKGGSGLGLALAKAIVEAHRGTIRADASPLGGLRVAVALPASS